MFNERSENVYFIGVNIDGLHTISVGTQTQQFYFYETLTGIMTILAI